MEKNTHFLAVHNEDVMFIFFNGLVYFLGKILCFLMGEKIHLVQLKWWDDVVGQVVLSHFFKKISLTAERYPFLNLYSNEVTIISGKKILFTDFFLELDCLLMYFFGVIIVIHYDTFIFLLY